MEERGVARGRLTSRGGVVDDSGVREEDAEQVACRVEAVLVATADAVLSKWL
jgi:hypothetical protein